MTALSLSKRNGGRGIIEVDLARLIIDDQRRRKALGIDLEADGEGRLGESPGPTPPSAAPSMAL